MSKDNMQYETTGKQDIDARALNSKAYRSAVTRHSTIYTLWLLANKHKIVLLAVGNVILVANWVFPEWPQLVLGLIGK